MPISKYYGGHGEEVMRDMRKRYGERAEEVFYATANKRDQKPKKKSHGRKSARGSVAREIEDQIT